MEIMTRSVFEEIYYSPKRYLDEHFRTRRSSEAYAKWRNKILERDGFKCVECNSPEDIHVHHIKQYSEGIRYRIKNGNGVTLCKSCHSNKHSWMIEESKKPVKIKTILRKSLQGSDGMIPLSAETPGASNEPGRVALNPGSMGQIRVSP